MVLTQPSEEIVAYYRITEMEKPELLYAKGPDADHPEEVAWSVAFAPTFEISGRSKSKVQEIVENEEPVSTILHYAN